MVVAIMQKAQKALINVCKLEMRHLNRPKMKTSLMPSIYLQKA